MTPIERCEAANCCPLGLAIRIKDPDAKHGDFGATFYADDFRPDPIKAAKFLGISEEIAEVIANTWDNGELVRGSAILAEKLGLI